MKMILKAMTLSLCTGMLFMLDVSVSPEFPTQVGLTLVPEAHAVFGVRRRAVRRGVVVGSSMAASEAAAASAAANSQPAAAPAAAPPPAPVAPATTDEPLPLGTVVSSLPPGCTPTPVGGVEYYYCGGNFYRTAFQGNQLVYVTAKP